jgi:hypothetical protein
LQADLAATEPALRIVVELLGTEETIERVAEIGARDATMHTNV